MRELETTDFPEYTTCSAEQLSIKYIREDLVEQQNEALLVQIKGYRSFLEDMLEVSEMRGNTRACTLLKEQLNKYPVEK